VAERVSLDDPSLRRRLDPDGVYDRIHNLPEQCREAWQQARDFALPFDYRAPEAVVVLGMGGSAIGGDFLAALADLEGRAPVRGVRGYDLPAWVTDRCLVVACSHSGATEETLSAFGRARTAGSRLAVVTSGGRLLEEARAAGVPHLSYDFAGEPRNALGHTFLRLLAVANAADVLSVDGRRVEDAIAAMTALRNELHEGVPGDSNRAKRLARWLHGHTGLAVGAAFLAPTARRLATQVQEHADSLCFYDELPELDHNLVVGMRLPTAAIRDLRAVFLDHTALHPRVRLRYDLTVEVFQRAGAGCERVAVGGESPLAAMLRAALLGDFVSYYLALLNGVRPSETAPIDWIKSRLAGG
jgi:glucose/mannose-6-phosphate isomerase